LQWRLIRAGGGAEIAKLALESILSAHKSGEASGDLQRLCSFVLSIRSAISVEKECITFRRRTSAPSGSV
jgi:hypothetical protein